MKTLKITMDIGNFETKVLFSDKLTTMRSNVSKLNDKDIELMKSFNTYNMIVNKDNQDSNIVAYDEEKYIVGAGATNRTDSFTTKASKNTVEATIRILTHVAKIVKETGINDVEVAFFTPIMTSQADKDEMRSRLKKSHVVEIDETYEVEFNIERVAILNESMFSFESFDEELPESFSIVDVGSTSIDVSTFRNGTLSTDSRETYVVPTGTFDYQNHNGKLSGKITEFNEMYTLLQKELIKVAKRVDKTYLITGCKEIEPIAKDIEGVKIPKVVLNDETQDTTFANVIGGYNTLKKGVWS